MKLIADLRTRVLLLLPSLFFALSAHGAPGATFHYQPAGAIFGDPVPFYHDGVHHMFYLHRSVDAAGKFTSALDWYHLTSRNLVHWEELPPAIRADANDRQIATGSIVERDGLFHAFYTTARVGDTGPGTASVRVATSKDLTTWTKATGEPLLLLKRDVPAVGTYDTSTHWRDPHVFWNPRAKEWWLAIGAHEKLTPRYPYAGVVALAASPDLQKWTVRPEPLLATRDGVAAECPDIFPFGRGWALVYYTDTTRVRLSDTPGGPWRRPANDAPWGLHFHAGKTHFDGQRRIITAFVPRVASDFTEPEYGGVMTLPRELYLDEQGAPAVRLVPEIIAACRDDATGGKNSAVFNAIPGGQVTAIAENMTFSAAAGGTAIAAWSDAPADFFLSADVTLEPGATLTLLLRGTKQAKPQGRTQPSSLDDSYGLTLDPLNGLVTLRRHDGWNRMPLLRNQTVGLPVGRPFKLHVMLHGDVLEAFVADRISISARVHLPGGALAVVARDGAARLSSLRLSHLPKSH